VKHENMKHEEGQASGLTYPEWELTVHADIKGDSLWLVEAYRLSLYLADLAWKDANALAKDRRMFDVADQLRRATRKIGASIAEGYSRDTGKGRSTYYEYGLGSARESRDWYFKSKFVLPAAVVQHRICLCTQIAKLTLTMISTERRRNRRVSDMSREP
jgi:four helix bundle protein